MEFKTVVAAVQVHDDLARPVIIAANWLAAPGASVHVVSAWAPMAPGVACYTADMGAIAGSLTQEAFAADREAKKADADALKALAKGLAPGATIAMLDGEAGHAIADYASEIGADVIVAGTHQKGFWDALLAGAPSRDVVKDAPCGVFLVNKAFAEKMNL